MTLDWCQLEFGLLTLLAPAHLLTDPAKGILSPAELNGYVPTSRLVEIYLRINHGRVYKTNHTGWNDSGFYDPLTGAGRGAEFYRREDLTCCGNVVWSVGGNKAWALDALAPAPSAAQIKDMPWFVHASTACYGRVPGDWAEGYNDKLAPADADHPNGIWRVTPFGDLEGATVPIVFVSADPLMPTMEHEGLHLRQIALEATRVKRLVGPIPSPYQR
jgi:hypothetical protein